jgi:hypothetical protein
MRKTSKYFEALLDDAAENTNTLIPIIVGIILMVLWGLVREQIYVDGPPEEIKKLVYSFILFVIGISGILGFRKGILLQAVILKGVIAKIINILFLISTWGIAILMLISLII